MLEPGQGTTLKRRNFIRLMSDAAAMEVTWIAGTGQKTLREETI
jgi:hypothetical protein